MLSTAFVAALALFQITTPPTKPAPDTVVATIDGKPLTAAEVEPYLWSWKSREVVREVADHRVIASAAAKRGVAASDAEVKAKLDTQLAAIKPRLQPGQTMDAFLDTQRMTMDHLTQLARTQVLLDKIVEADFKPADYVKLDALFFQAGESTAPAVQAKAVKDADAAYASLAAGKAWDAVFKADTMAPNPLAVGGPIPWTPLDRLPESVRAQIAALKPQGYTKPTPVPNGIQIFHLSARGAEASPADLAQIKEQYVSTSRGLVLQRLRDAAKVEIK